MISVTTYLVRVHAHRDASYESLAALHVGIFESALPDGSRVPTVARLIRTWPRVLLVSTRGATVLPVTDNMARAQPVAWQICT